VVRFCELACQGPSFELQNGFSGDIWPPRNVNRRDPSVLLPAPHRNVTAPYLAAPRADSLNLGNILRFIQFHAVCHTPVSLGISGSRRGSCRGQTGCTVPQTVNPRPQRLFCESGAINGELLYWLNFRLN